MLLLVGGTGNEAWAYKVTYHVLTLPMNSTKGTKNTKSKYDGWRTEAITVIAENVYTVELPEKYKSPLAINFKYYDASSITTYSGGAQEIYGIYDQSENLDQSNNLTKFYLYKINSVDADASGTSNELTEGASLTSDCHIYVIYEYNTANTIADLTGGTVYNLTLSNGFLAFNRGRNNRVSIFPKNKPTFKDLSSETFTKVDVSGTQINPYWNDANANKNKRADTEGQFHFLFKYEGADPYNITIRTAYEGNKYYIEKYDKTDTDFMNKYYKESSIFAERANNVFIASDDNQQYTNPYTSGTSGVTSDGKPGFYRNFAAPVWNSFALLNSSDANHPGYVYMVSRITDADGASYTPTKKNNKYQYYYLKNVNSNNINFVLMDHELASKEQFADDQMYKIKTFKFIVKTSFGHQLIETVRLSEYTERYDPISIEHVPSLKRKYCDYKFYKDAALEHEITKYTELGEGSNTIYVGHKTSDDSPFKPINPTDPYTTATWYELTDEKSTQSSGKKLNWDGSEFKNNGPAGEDNPEHPYYKESEFAFIGDPYELKVINRKLTEDADPKKYVGSTLEVNSSSINVLYDQLNGIEYSFEEPYEIQTMTINVNGLPYASGNTITVTVGGADAGQASISPSTIVIEPDDVDGVNQDYGHATFDVNISQASGDKTFTLTIQAKNSSNDNIGTYTVITINQKADGYSWDIPFDNTAGSFLLRKFNSNEGYWNWTTTSAGNPLRYSTSSSTRIAMMDLPKSTYYYNIVNLAGKVAARASIKQTVFSPLSHSSIPSIIYSPYLEGETLKFYDKDSYTDKNSDGKTDRTDFSSQTPITETPGTGNVNIYVTYTTSQLASRPINLTDEQQFNVKLNGEYIYYDNDDNGIKSNASPESSDLSSSAYLWMFRNRDPYNILIDNLGARTTLSVSGSSNVNIYNTNGTGAFTEESKSNGAWVQVAGGTWGNGKDLGFTTERGQASPFIIKSSPTSGVYELMAADGSVDASTTYYHIGRTDNTVKIYSNISYVHGDDKLKVLLEKQDINCTYHLIDKAYNDLLQVTSKSPDLALPAEYQSPLVARYHYWNASAFKSSDPTKGFDGSPTEITSIADGTSVSGVTHIYVTYDTDEQFGFGTKNPYMLKFLNGKEYKLEDGNDRLTNGKMQAMYPYCNGDGNLNIYGEESNREQMEGGSSTRPRWVWFIESENHDPYHVKIHSRSTISFNGASNPTYLHTSAVHFKQDEENTKHIVTGGNLQGISQVSATEYMILGEKTPTTTKYKLLTTDPITEVTVDDNVSGSADKDKRRYVTSFEQYWKTNNMLKKHVLEIDEDVYSTDPETYVMPDDLWPDLKAKLGTLGVNNTEDMNYIDGSVWHSYVAVANALRWNGYNAEGTHNSKTVESLEHWFQTFDMGDGTFEIESADIPPVLVLLDRHGWEIMRKAIPTPGESENDKAEKLVALKAYDSPMVKEYKFYNNATKATGCHKYVLKTNSEIKVNGKQFTSTSLATLPTLTADSYGTYPDIFVTYTVKEEYDKSYKYTFTDNGGSSYTESGTPSAFLFIQNGNFAQDNTTDSDLTDIDAVPTGGDVSEYIVSNIDKLSTTGDKKDELWYLQPNLHIDKEMGIVWATETKSSNEPLTEYEMKVKYKDNTGFDPYNLQIESVAQPGYYLTTHMNTTQRSGGGMIGDYTGAGNSKNVTLEAWVNQKNVDTGVDRGSEGHDHTYIQMTNQTFMAVQDANGNMQLMPRFDHTQRVNAFTALADAVTHTRQAAVDDPETGENAMGEQTTFFVRPMVFNYIIVDNQGRESLRYRSAGESYPFIPEHFKSPLATDFKYYKTLDDNNNDGIYELTSLADEITSSFAAKDINGTTNNIFVRYRYDVSSSDNELDKVILEGKWLTMKLNNCDVYANGTLNSNGYGISLLGGTKPTESLSAQKQWQWKFLASPCVDASYYVAPDPYAVQIFNREANHETNKMSIAIKTDDADCFAILSHEDGGYALAQAGRKDYNYYFLQGIDTYGNVIDLNHSASVRQETGFNSKTNNFAESRSQLLVTDDISHNFVYKVITNDKKLAISGTKAGYTPSLPTEISSPLLNAEDYLYYGTALVSGDTYEVYDDEKDGNNSLSSRIETLYGLYDDVVYVRYKYNMDTTPYGVPNKRNATGGTIAADPTSNDAALDISGELPYNIIWETDNMMKSDGSTISDGGSHELNGDNQNIWYFTNNDPYALKIKHDDNKYVNGSSTLTDANGAKAFMLLNKEGYDYGILQETGGSQKLTGYGQELTTGDSAPNKFIVFALSTHKLIYHLVIANTGNKVNIPYRSGTEESPGPLEEKEISGTTQRDLTSMDNGVPGDKYQLGETISGQTYSVDAGQVSIGDVLEVPGVFNRPNCNYFFYIDNIQTKPSTLSTYQYAANDNTEYETKRASLSSTGYYYFKIGTSTYKRVHVTSIPPSLVYTEVDCTEDDWENAWQDDDELNKHYKGLEVGTGETEKRLMSDAGLIESLVKVNIAYSFMTGLETNAGEGFVTSTDQNLWYTFETQDVATPYLAHYTNAWGLQSMEGRETRYTNDYLWTPLGDVYGFRMYNRYMIKNSGGVNNVMTYAGVADEGKNLLLAVPSTTEKPTDYLAGNEVFELLGSNSPGYFRIHPVINKDGTQYYVRKDPSDNYAKLSTTYSEWTFNLTPELLKPYVDRIGYVGGLTKDAYDDNKTVLDKVMNGTATYEELLTVQGIVYDDDNIVSYKPGYYRLHNQPDVSDIDPVRYASGYLHKTELTPGTGTKPSPVAIPMHFYSKSGVTTKYAGEGSLKSGYTISNATRGDIPIAPTEQDPSTIFYFAGSGTLDGNPRSTMQTQGLYVAANPNGDSDNGTTTNRLQRAVMKDIAPEYVATQAITFSLMDIGGAVLLIHNGAEPRERIYLNYDQSNFFQRTATDETDYNSKKSALTSIGDYYFKIGSSTYKVVKVTGLDPYTSSEESSDETAWTNAADIYDLKYYHDSPTDDAKWCMEPANNQGLLVETHSGGDDYYYTTFCAPYDVLLPDDDGTKIYGAYVYNQAWPTSTTETIIHPVRVPAQVIAEKSYEIGKFVPATTPVIIRTTDNSGKVKLSLPTSEPTTPAVSCIFTGKYLEQLLETKISSNDKVYAFGLPITGYGLNIDPSSDNNGTIIDYINRKQASTGVGFYINATQNKELDKNNELWYPNNRYVIHNKIYYRSTEDPGASSRELTRSPEFIPVVFDDDEGEEDEPIEESLRQQVFNGCVYDLQGRCVATEEMVKDGTWRRNLKRGIYILNGKKVYVK